MITETIIEALHEYFKKCPLLENNRLNSGYLPEDTKQSGVEYSLDTIPGAGIIKKYMDGSALCQYTFVISSVNDYSPDLLQNITNCGFFEELDAWMLAQTRRRNFPELPQGMRPMKLEALDTGYLFTVSPDAGKYQIQCRLEYYKKGER